MEYTDDIILVLKEVGRQGMPLRRIVLNVYNMRNSMFAPLDQQRLYADIGQWLRAEGQRPSGLVEKCEVQGWYRLNANSRHVQQLLMEFEPNEDDSWMM